MIDPTSETLISFGEAGRLLSIDAKPTNPCTIWRWASKGRRGVKLEILRLGGRTVTSREAVGRFVAAINPTEPPAPTPHARTPTARRRAAERASKTLEAMGI